MKRILEINIMNWCLSNTLCQKHCDESMIVIKFLLISSTFYHLFTTFSLILTGLNVLEMLNFIKKYLDIVTSELHPFFQSRADITVVHFKVWS